MNLKQQIEFIEKLSSSEFSDEQKREMICEKIVEHTVNTADRIIIEHSDGSCEETDALTSEVAQKFNEKVNQALSRRLRSKRLMDRVQKEKGKKHYETRTTS